MIRAANGRHPIAIFIIALMSNEQQIVYLDNGESIDLIDYIRQKICNDMFFIYRQCNNFEIPTIETLDKIRPLVKANFNRSAWRAYEIAKKLGLKDESKKFKKISIQNLNSDGFFILRSRYCRKNIGGWFFGLLSQCCAESETEFIREYGLFNPENRFLNNNVDVDRGSLKCLRM